MAADIAIFAIGSPNGVDQAGLILADELIRQHFSHRYPQTRMTIAGGQPHDLLALTENMPGLLILIDAMIAEPGTIKRIDDVSLLTQSDTRSTHGLGIREIWALLEQLAEKPPMLCIFAVGAGNPTADIDLSREDFSSIRQAMPALLDQLDETVRNFLYQDKQTRQMLF